MPALKGKKRKNQMLLNDSGKCKNINLFVCTLGGLIFLEFCLHSNFVLFNY